MNYLASKINNRLELMYQSAIRSTARHGMAGGTFTSKLWANGVVMIAPDVEWATSAHSLPEDVHNGIKANGWRIK